MRPCESDRWRYAQMSRALRSPSAPAAYQVALVRPGVGAWLSAIADGGARDADGLSDGELTISPLELVSLGGESLAPQSLEARDVVIAIDQDTLEVAVMSLVPALQGGE